MSADEAEGRAAMFADGNRIRFERPIDEAARAWWIAAFFEPHGLTPEDVGDRLTRSADVEKTIRYRYIDAASHSFGLRVEGRFSDFGDVWYVERSLELDGDFFSADAMFVASADRRLGRGQALMGDLMALARMLQISRIKVEAEHVGRYAWLRMGFLPDRASWRNIQLEAARFIGRNRERLDAEAGRILDAVRDGGPSCARWLAALEVPVPSRMQHDGEGRPLDQPFGKTFFIEASPNWTGEFLFDPESERIAAAYLATAGGT